MNRVVVTAQSVHSALGNDVDEFSRRLFAGESGVVDIRGRAVAENFPVPFGALAAPLEGMPERRERKIHKEFRIATNHLLSRLLEDAPAKLSIDAVLFGTDNLYKGDVPGFFADPANPETRHREPLDFLRDSLAREGRVIGARFASVANACATGNVLLGTAFERIRAGAWTRAIVGALDSRLRVENIMPFHLLGALTTADVSADQASRPFSVDRSGFVKAEGGGMLLLESEAAARARGAKILGRVAGFGQTCDAFHLTDGREDGKAAIRAMEIALADSGIPKENIDVVSAHGTSTPMNDRLETMAIKTVFKGHARRLAVTAQKSQLGHATVACGLVETIAALAMLREGKIAPTLNLNNPDPECDLDYVPLRTRKSAPGAILKNSFGFGGVNACLILEAP